MSEVDHLWERISLLRGIDTIQSLTLDFVFETKETKRHRDCSCYREACFEDYITRCTETELEWIQSQVRHSFPTKTIEEIHYSSDERIFDRVVWEDLVINCENLKVLTWKQQDDDLKFDVSNTNLAHCRLEEIRIEGYWSHLPNPDFAKLLSKAKIIQIGGDNFEYRRAHCNIVVFISAAAETLEELRLTNINAQHDQESVLRFDKVKVLELNEVAFDPPLTIEASALKELYIKHPDTASHRDLTSSITSITSVMTSCTATLEKLDFAISPLGVPLAEISFQLPHCKNLVLRYRSRSDFSGFSAIFDSTDQDLQNLLPSLESLTIDIDNCSFDEICSFFIAKKKVVGHPQVALHITRPNWEDGNTDKLLKTISHFTYEEDDEIETVWGTSG